MRLAAESVGAGRVSLHLRAENGEALALQAISDPDAAWGSPPTLRAADPLVERVLATPGPVIAASEGSSGATLVLVRICSGAGEPVGMVTFALTVSGGEPNNALLQRIVAVAALVESALAAGIGAAELTAANNALHARAAVDRRFAEVTQSGGTLSALVRQCAALTGKVVALFDSDGRQLLTSGAGTPMVRLPSLRDILLSCGPSSADSTAPLIAPAGGGSGLSRRKIVVPVVGSARTYGWLVIDEYPSGFRAIDKYVAQLAAAHLGMEFVVQSRITRVAWNAKTSLARQMIRGTQTPRDLVASAEYLGVDVEARRVLAYVLQPPSARQDESLDQELAAEVERELGVEVLATRGSEGVVLLVEAPAERGTVAMVSEVKASVSAVTARLCGEGVIVGVSPVCEPSGLSRGYREAREVVHCIDRFASGAAHRVLAVDDLGPARLFLANSDSSAVRGYVADVLGPLLNGDTGMSDLLLTLQSYFDASRSVRTSAAHLGVHENTIRLRLARVATATGLDVAGDANDQLSVQTALLVLRLQGHPALPAFGTRLGGPTDDASETERKTA